MSHQIIVNDANKMFDLGQTWSKKLEAGRVVFLSGDLGAGKTTLVQGMLAGLGHSGRVKSPTFTLVEPYSFSRYEVYHFDLYRLESAEELESLGVRDFFNSRSICLIEWPEKGFGFLPEPDVEIIIQHQAEGRLISAPKLWGMNV